MSSDHMVNRRHHSRLLVGSLVFIILIVGLALWWRVQRSIRADQPPQPSLEALSHGVLVYNLFGANNDLDSVMTEAKKAGVTAAIANPPTDPSVRTLYNQYQIHIVSHQISQLLYNYQCYLLSDSLPNSCLGRQLTVHTEPELYQAVRDYLNNIKDDPLVIGHYVLDDWFRQAPGSAKPLLENIRQIIAEVTPNIPTLCGFGATIDPGGNDRWRPDVPLNFSPKACDGVLLYIYAGPASDPIDYPDTYDWGLTTILPKIFSDLAAQGWDRQKQPFIGVGDAFASQKSDTSTGPYNVVPKPADLAREMTSFCQNGAFGIGYFTWNHRAYLSPTTNDILKQGVVQGSAACADYWQSQATATPAILPVSPSATALVDLPTSSPKVSMTVSPVIHAVSTPVLRSTPATKSKAHTSLLNSQTSSPLGAPSSTDSLSDRSSLSSPSSLPLAPGYQPRHSFWQTVYLGWIVLLNYLQLHLAT